MFQTRAATPHPGRRKVRRRPFTVSSQAHPRLKTGQHLLGEHLYALTYTHACAPVIPLAPIPSAAPVWNGAQNPLEPLELNVLLRRPRTPLETCVGKHNAHVDNCEITDKQATETLTWHHNPPSHRYFTSQHAAVRDPGSAKTRERVLLRARQSEGSFDTDSNDMTTMEKEAHPKDNRMEDEASDLITHANSSHMALDKFTSPPGTYKDVDLDILRQFNEISTTRILVDWMRKFSAESLTYQSLSVQVEISLREVICETADELQPSATRCAIVLDSLLKLVDAKDNLRPVLGPLMNEA